MAENRPGRTRARLRTALSHVGSKAAAPRPLDEDGPTAYGGPRTALLGGPISEDRTFDGADVDTGPNVQTCS